MTLVGFQQALSELVMSSEFCLQVLTSPDLALGVFDLTPLEHQRLVFLARTPGLGIGRMLHRSFRLSMLVNLLPKTCTVLNTQNLNQVFNIYWQTQPPRNFYYQQEAVRFGEFLLAQLEQGTIQNEFLEEILRFEISVLSLMRFIPEQVVGNNSLKLGVSEDFFPHLNPQYRIVFFRHEPDSLLTTLNEGRVPESGLQGDYYLLLTMSSTNQLQIKPIGSRLGEILLACNGQRSVSHLCTQLSLTLQDLEILAERGFLSFHHQASILSASDFFR
ncbi:MAG: hypothetical protein KME46_28275 [Brasilonema angustatum HA4187-MV1]|jgi:hypothetical protein|nr:hypothetical protein [Brasilonema angustatum HA4187-MV1]